eukprot:CAMPEP_0197530008 /NCGR_PEP_ID=MMETSP1318-20131121/30386_1 /TAXON_ID=552666 /ORGANISM="Partenskyella glossopodia, Strain RCC365" /LENGTH=63 /DNA_ID=CAMNT_0043085669 /DNA_START=963 /DNA_END=1157 /DNA_ORIENTATION=+
MEAVGYAFQELGEKGVAAAFESTLKVLVDAILIQGGKGQLYSSFSEGERKIVGANVPHRDCPF